MCTLLNAPVTEYVAALGQAKWFLASIDGGETFVANKRLHVCCLRYLLFLKANIFFFICLSQYTEIREPGRAYTTAREMLLTQQC